MNRYTSFVCILGFFLASCRNNTTQTKGNFPGKNDSIFGAWLNVNTIIPKRAKILLDSDSNFKYINRKSFSTGYYTFLNDTLTLESVLPDSCLFMRNFGNDLLPLKIAIDSLSNPNVTIKHCRPSKKDVYFIHLNKALFFYENDTLFFIDEKGEIDTLNIYYHVH